MDGQVEKRVRTLINIHSKVSHPRVSRGSDAAQVAMSCAGLVIRLSPPPLKRLVGALIKDSAGC